MAQVISRRTLVVLILAAASPVRAASCPPPRVLLVCPFGTVKSAIARELLARKAAAQSVPVEVRSRGIRIEDHVSPALGARLKADGLNVSSQPPAELQAADVRWADVVVAFDEASDSRLLSEKQAWRTPSWLADYDVARADLEQRLEGLIAELRDVETCEAKRP